MLDSVYKMGALTNKYMPTKAALGIKKLRNNIIKDGYFS